MAAQSGSGKSSGCCWNRRARRCYAPRMIHASRQSRLQAFSLKGDDIPPVLLLLAFSGLALCMPPQTDTWWHLRAGGEMVTTGRFLTTDQFAHTIYGAPLYHDHHWL